MPAGRKSVPVSGGPLYQRVADVLKEDILKGIHPVGSALPSEESLTRRFGVSRATVREALRLLRDQGLVQSRRGAGTTVARSADMRRQVRELASISDLVDFAHSTRYEVQSMGLVAAGKSLAQRLSCPIGTQWFALSGPRFNEDSELPMCWTEVYLDAKYAGVGRLIERERGPIFELIEDLYGVRVAEVQQELSAGPASREMAARLAIEPGAAVVYVNRIFRLTSGEASQWVFNCHPADRFRFSMTIRRVTS